MRRKKRQKRITGAVAGGLIVTLVLVGTYAWTSISQHAVDENVLDITVGGRIHDDWNGENKDVYAENFTTIKESGKNLFVRIRLDEYMETMKAGGTTIPLVEGTKANDVKTWQTRKPNDSANPFLAYWNWEMGGSTVYMPTFNKNRDSLAVDVNGDYDKSSAQKEHYADYVTYTIGESKTEKAYYDADSNTLDEDSTKPGNAGTLGENYTKQTEKHEAKETRENITDYTYEIIIENIHCANIGGKSSTLGSSK